MNRIATLTAVLSLISAHDINLSENDYSDLCVPKPYSSAGEIQLLEFTNGSVWVQQIEVFESVSNVTVDEFTSQQSTLSTQLSASTGVQQVWYTNVLGVRTTTTTSMCMFASSGCTTPYNATLGIAMEGANNSETWIYLAQIPPQSDHHSKETLAPSSQLSFGGCYNQNCSAFLKPFPGDVLVHIESKCMVMQWQLPLPTGVDFLTILTDPKGNEYIHYLFNGSFVEPDSSNYPEGWTLSKKTFVEGDIFTISPEESKDTCREMGTDGNSPCTYMLAEDSDGNTYHRYLYKEDGEIMVHPIQSALITPEQPATCAAQCEAKE
eukprot:CFRG0712T1